MDRSTAEEAARTVLAQGCSAVHIGGGEPFLDPDNLAMVLGACARAGLGVEYVETNCSWFRDPDHAETLLKRLKDAGLATLLVSISPLHNEFIPFSRTRGVMAACRKAGVGVFPWVQSFLPDLETFDPASTHALEEYARLFGPDYVARIPSRYWIHQGGRALELLRPYAAAAPAKDIAARSDRPCTELLDTSHFHVDLYGNYVPGLCAGLAVAMRDLGRPLDSDSYPLLTLLLTGGVAALLDFARAEHSFAPRESGYISKCDLCTHIRSHLARKARLTSRDLQPQGFYAKQDS